MSHQIDVEKVLLQELMEDSPDYIFIKDRQSRFLIRWIQLISATKEVKGEAS